MGEEVEGLSSFCKTRVSCLFRNGDEWVSGEGGPGSCGSVPSGSTWDVRSRSTEGEGHSLQGLRSGVKSDEESFLRSKGVGILRTVVSEGGVRTRVIPVLPDVTPSGTWVWGGDGGWGMRSELDLSFQKESRILGPG